MVKTILPDGTSITYEYDAAGNMIKKICPLDVVYCYEYDSVGNNTKIIYPDGTTEVFKYDENGNLVTGTDKKGNITTYSQDKNVEKLAVATDSYGNKLEYEYDKHGRITKEDLTQGQSTTYAYDAAGNVLSETDSLGNVTKYEYNVWGELIKETDSNNNITSYSYDAAGNCIEKKTPEGLDIFYSYDKNYNITQIKTAVQGKELTEKYTYDAMGNVLSYTDTMGRITEYTYDKLNRLSSEKGIDGIVIKYTYDSVGNIVSEEHSDGSLYKAEYDELGRLVSATNIGSSDDKKTKIYTYKYDSMGRIVSTIDPMKYETTSSYDELGNTASCTDAMGGITKYTYDKTSRLIAEENAIGAKKQYTYNDKGYLISEKNSRGQITEYSYDDYGRIIGFKDEVGTVSYSYDKNSNLIKVSDETGTIIRTYDSLNRVTSVTDSNGKKVEYSYDELGNVISLTYPGGEIVRYEYNLDASLKSVTDGANNKTTYEYDSAGRLIKTTKPDGSTEEKTYDESGNIKTQITKNSAGEVVLSYEYAYDGFGNIISVKDNIDFSDSVSYSYEGSSDVASYSVESSEDKTITRSSAEMKYDSANRLISYNGKEVKYDADGNMIYGPLDGKMTEFKYDARNRLIQAGDVKYNYDAENVRISAEYVKYTETYVTDRESDLSRTLQIIRDKDTVNYYYGVGLIYENSITGILVYHFDHLGSTRKITDKAGKIKYSFHYGTYGELLSVWDSDSTENSDAKSDSIASSITLASINSKHPIRFLYNGALGVITDDSGLLYMRQRYYDTDIKRFINQDVLTGDTTESQSLNRYAYVQGNPINYNDPFGLSPRHILAPYANVAHDILNIASIVPGPVGAIAGVTNAMVYLLMGDRVNACKCIIQAALTGAALPIAGIAIGGLCNLNTTARLVTAFTLIGAGAYTVGTSFVDFCSYYEKLSAEIAKGENANGADIFHYISGLIQSGAGMVYGGLSIAGGASGLMNLCFVAGTEITTDDGLKNIEDIEEGDVVWSCNPDTGETGLKSVKQVFVNETDELVHITITNDSGKTENIDTTVRHPFYVVDYGFKYASELKIGDKVKSVDGDIYEVSNVDNEKLAKPVKVYNFEVEDWHTYFVSINSLLVHNQCINNASNNTVNGNGANKTSSFDKWLNKGETNNKVYYGIDKNGNAVYTGITKQSKNARLYQHNKMGKEFTDLEVQYSGLTRNQARAIEQYLIENGPNEKNIINSISPKSEYYNEAMEWAEKYIKEN